MYNESSQTDTSDTRHTGDSRNTCISFTSGTSAGWFKDGREDHSTCVDFTVDYQLSLKETLLEKTPA